MNAEAPITNLTKREFFAIMVLQGLAQSKAPTFSTADRPQARVQVALNYADELVKQLESKK